VEGEDETVRGHEGPGGD